MSVAVLSLLAALAMNCFAPAVLADGNADAAAGRTIVEIADADGLRAIADASDGDYRLTADIDMGGAAWTPIAFAGTLDGAGHSLYNLKISSAGSEIRETRDGNMKSYETQFAGLFSTLENAEVKDLHIVDAQVYPESDIHCFAAILAGYMENSVVNSCSVSGRVRLDSHGVNAGTGGLIGYGCGSIAQCAADVETVFVDMLEKGRCEQFMGGILACGIADISGCRVNIEGYDSCHGYVHNGGLVGMYYSCGFKIKSGEVKNNDVTGRIRFFEDNRDRRAYCKPFIGEDLMPPRKTRIEDNTSDFLRDETYDYAKVLLPEKCETPSYTETIVPSDCTQWGYTVHECSVCGYHWRDSYSPPRHTEGEWEIVSASDAGHEGLRRLRCSVCGELLAEETIPPLSDGGDGEKLYEWADRAAIPAAVLLVIAAVGGAAVVVFRRKSAARKEKSN